MTKTNEKRLCTVGTDSGVCTGWVFCGFSISPLYSSTGFGEDLCYYLLLLSRWRLVGSQLFSNFFTRGGSGVYFIHVASFLLLTDGVLVERGGGDCCWGVFFSVWGGKFFFVEAWQKWSSIDLVCCAGFFLFSILSIAAGFFFILFFCTRLKLV
ncbi:hypothetical protein HOY80DRAFT_974381 [Tuber brumale]|nr:hypothetical protein HOY80DRAFT_974381 [Tuber brumale]